MAKKKLGYVELEWTCPNCGTRNPGPEQSCVNCGSPQPDDVHFEQARSAALATWQLRKFVKNVVATWLKDWNASPGESWEHLKQGR